ncbi:CDC27 protein [Sporothrix stenoceras]
MSSPKEFLADEVLVEKKVPGSLHATYLLYGTKAGEGTSPAQNGGAAEEDIDMEDGLLPDYLQSDKVPTTVITLVAEGNLESALAQYESLDAIHVYSVSPQPITDLQQLADTTRQLCELRGSAAPEDSPKTFGTIPNSHVRRRQRKGQAPIAAAAAAPAPAATPSSVFAKTTPKPAAADAPGPKSIWNKVNAAKENKDDNKSSAASSKPAVADSATPETKDAKKPIAAASSSAAAPPALKRAGSSGGGGIMQAFAKGANAPKPKKREPLPAVAKKPAEEDTTMGMSDSGDDDDNDEDVIPKAQQVVGGKSRQERQEELRKMMEEDDDDDDEKDEDEREDTPMEDVEEEKPAEPTAPAKDEGPSEVVTASSGDGRRRGKRRVMRKKMIEDKDGYLVTIQEAGWESFSEDEAPPKAAPVSAAPAASAASSSSSAKAKKPAPKTGQGSIMSFFGKK